MIKYNELKWVTDVKPAIEKVKNALIKAGWILRVNDGYYYLFHKPGKESLQILELATDSKVVDMYRFAVID